MLLFSRIGGSILRQFAQQLEFKLSCNVIVPSIVCKQFCSYNSPSPLRSKKAKSTRASTHHFVDFYRIRTVGGNGGNGAISFLRLFANEFAGPDGADGGNGGHVIFAADNIVTGLNNIKSVIEAPHGEKGGNKDCTGKNAKNIIINVPVGTIFKDDEGTIVADLHTEGMMFVASRGGAGGKGNKYFATDVEQTPEIAELGAQGETNVYFLELRSMAHIGLIGYPNAGKSTLLRAVTRARPRVAPYPFTTLRPHLGTVLYNDYEQLTIADLPGLIDGSHKNKGLGIQFLQHAERCAGLLYMVDTSLPEPWKQVKNLQFEISKFSPGMLQRPYVIVANKIDLTEAQDNLKELEKHFEGTEVIPISAKQGLNLSAVLNVIRRIYDAKDSGKDKDNNK